MAWVVQTKESKGVTLYKIWSTISDSYITEKWLYKQEIDKFFFWYRFQDFVEKFVEDSMTFPNGYCETDGRRLKPDEAKANEFSNLILANYNDTSLLPTKFLEILKELDIKLDVSDLKYNISTNEI